MSILNRNIEDEPRRGKMAAEKMIKITKQTFEQMVMAFNYGSELFWDNKSGVEPAEVALELGSDAAEVFYLHARLGELISKVQPEAIQKGLSVVGNFQINDDGTINVIIPTPEPEVVIPDPSGVTSTTTVPPEVL
jgi:hypothetical protein